MFEYIRHLFAQVVIVLFLGNVALLLMPKSLRRTFLGTFKFATVIVKFTVNLLERVVKRIVANAENVIKEPSETQKETEKPTSKTKQPSRNTKSKGKVIQFPNVK